MNTTNTTTATSVPLARWSETAPRRAPAEPRTTWARQEWTSSTAESLVSFFVAHTADSFVKYLVVTQTAKGGWHFWIQVFLAGGVGFLKGAEELPTYIV